MKNHYDVIVIGGGCAGVACAIAAAKNGAKTLLVEQGPMPGGDLLSGLPIDGCLNTRGEWIVGGVIRQLLDACEARGGYIGPVCDYRALWVVCVDHRVMPFAIMDLLNQYGVELLLYSFASDVQAQNGVIKSISIQNKQGQHSLTADVLIDCTGDGDIAVKAGAPFEQGGADASDLQPVSLVYSMANVNAKALLDFALAHPENLSVGEAPSIRNGRTDAELMEALHAQGIAKVFFVGDGPLMSKAIADGVLTASSLMATIPNSIERGEVSINSTRVAIDATNTEDMSGALGALHAQIDNGVSFLKRYVPGFENAYFTGTAPRIGIRETRRILGDYVLTDDDVLEARKRQDGVAKGGHEYDIHGAGTAHIRKQLKDGGSYDIPYGCIVPQGVQNLYMAGRQLSATRGAHSTARVMGTCMALGEAAGTAAALCSHEGLNPRQVDVHSLREKLRAQGVVLDGTY